VNDARDDVAARFRALLGRRWFVDREAGVLLVWLAADRRELVELVPQVEARHPAARFSVQESGSAVAVRMSAREEDLAEIEALYVTYPGERTA
jgi:hypothetical protein